MKFKIKVDEIRRLMEIDSPEFPKNAQATRPKVVGQVSEFIKEFTGRTLGEWEQWYLERYPDSIDKATKKNSGNDKQL